MCIGMFCSVHLQSFRLLRVKNIPLYDIITQYGYYILKIYWMYWIYYIGYVQKRIYEDSKVSFFT